MAVTHHNIVAPKFSFIQMTTTAKNVRLRLYDTNEGFIWEAEIPAATWTAINTAMVTNDATSSYEVPALKAGALSALVPAFTP